MKSLSSIGLGLSVAFGCLLLALIVEIYYLLWWKKRFLRREIEVNYRTSSSNHHNPASEFFHTFCCKKPPSSSIVNPQESTNFNQSSANLAESHLHTHKEDYFLKPFDEENGGGLVDAELQLMAGPPRFLFTIKEETKEDLESEDGNRSRGDARRGSLSELLRSMDTPPYLTPISSPQFFTPPVTPMVQKTQHGGPYNSPSYELSAEAEFNKIRSSPPPRFKFLRDAEDKLQRKIVMEEAEKMNNSGSGKPGSMLQHKEEDGSVVAIIVGQTEKSDVNQQLPQQYCHSSASAQVLPLASSPTTLGISSDTNPISPKSSFC